MGTDCDGPLPSTRPHMAIRRACQARCSSSTAALADVGGSLVCDVGLNAIRATWDSVRALPACKTWASLRVTIHTTAWGIDHQLDGVLSSPIVQYHPITLSEKYSVKDGCPREFGNSVLIVRPLDGIEEGVVVEMVSSVLPRALECGFLSCCVPQFRRELDDDRAVVHLLDAVGRTGQESFAREQIHIGFAEYRHPIDVWHESLWNMTGNKEVLLGPGRV